MYLGAILLAEREEQIEASPGGKQKIRAEK